MQIVRGKNTGPASLRCNALVYLIKIIEPEKPADKIRKASVGARPKESE